MKNQCTEKKLHREGWCRENNLVLIGNKTKEMIDFRSSQPKHAPLSISGCTVERVENIKFPGVQMSQDLIWNKNTLGIMKLAQQRLYFLRKLEQASLPISILRTFYSVVLVSVLMMYCFSTWYSNCSVSDKKALQRIVRGAERVIRVSFLSVQELFLSRCRSMTLNTIRYTSHPLLTIFELLPSGKRFQSQKGQTNRLINSFLPQAV